MKIYKNIFINLARIAGFVFIPIIAIVIICGIEAIDLFKKARKNDLYIKDVGTSMKKIILIILFNLVR